MPDYKVLFELMCSYYYTLFEGNEPGDEPFKLMQKHGLVDEDYEWNYGEEDEEEEDPDDGK